MLRKMTVGAACAALASVTMVTGAIAAGGGHKDGHQGKIVRGRTGQGRTIHLQISPGRIDIKNFSIRLNCSGGYLLIDQESGFLPSSANRHGMINDRQFGSTDEVLIRARLRGHTVHGKIRVRDRLGKHRCSSPWVRFSAHG